MKFIGSLAIGLLFAIPASSDDVFDRMSQNTNYGKPIDELTDKRIHAGMPSDQMLDLCIPATKRTIGLFTEYEFMGMPVVKG